MAKYWLLENKELQLPPFTVCSEGVSRLDEPFGEAIYVFREVSTLEDIEDEKYLREFNIQPDLLCTIEMFGRKHNLAIEIAVTHKVDDEKRDKILDSNLNMVEIDMAHLLHEDTWAMESVGDAISDLRYSQWIHVCEGLRDHLYNDTLSRGVRCWVQRNKEIDSWHDDLQQYFRLNPEIYFPPFSYSKATLKDFVEDLDGVMHPVKIPLPPDISGSYKLVQIDPIKNQCLKVHLEWKGDLVPVYVGLTMEGISIHRKGAGVLRVTGVIPQPENFEKSLRWVKSKKAQVFIDKCDALRNAVKVDADMRLKKDIYAKWEKIQHFLTLEQKEEPVPVRSMDVASLMDKSNSCKTELLRKGYNLKELSGPVKGYWIFGCNFDHWQLPLFTELVNSAQVLIDLRLADKMLSDLGFKVMPEVKALTYKKQLLKKINANMAQNLPTSFSVIALYLDGLMYGEYLLEVEGGYQVNRLLV